MAAAVIAARSNGQNRVHHSEREEARLHLDRRSASPLDLDKAEETVMPSVNLSRSLFRLSLARFLSLSISLMRKRQSYLW